MQGYEKLVRKAQAAEGSAREEAFGELIAPFQSIARGWAYNRLGDAQQAQDVVQEAFLTAYQKIDQLRDPAAFPAWLKRIVLTYCHRATRRKSPHLLPLEDDAAAPQSDPAANAEDREMKDRVNRAVRALPDHERVVTEMFYITGYSQQEIAEALALPLTTVKKRLQYAREHLRETMPTMSLGGSATGALYQPSMPIGELTLDAEMLRFIALLHPELLATA